MTTQTAVNIFNILKDEWGAPHVVDSEIVDLLNMATYEWLSRLVPSNLGKVVNYELDQNTLSAIRPLVYSMSLTPPDNLITDSEITTALQSAGAETGATWFRIMSLAVVNSGITYPVKFRKWNDFRIFHRNFFKKASLSQPTFLLHKNTIEINPFTAGSSVFIAVIKTPRALSLTGPVNPELEDAQMYNIIAIALKLGGVAVRDEELIRDVRNTALQTLQ